MQAVGCGAASEPGFCSWAGMELGPQTAPVRVCVCWCVCLCVCAWLCAHTPFLLDISSARGQQMDHGSIPSSQQ